MTECSRLHVSSLKTDQIRLSVVVALDGGDIVVLDDVEIVLTGSLCQFLLVTVEILMGFIPIQLHRGSQNTALIVTWTLSVIKMVFGILHA